MTPLPTIVNLKPEATWRTRLNAHNSVSRFFSGRKAQTVPIAREPQFGVSRGLNASISMLFGQT